VNRTDDPRPARFVTQHLHPDGRRLPPPEQMDAEVERLQAEGFFVIKLVTHYTQHSLDNGHGPGEWTPNPQASSQ
jgi:hypothetical protein